ncbi:MAG TPA: hypothetical protein VFA18_15545 [Gemmataceae bacterium]|nr:hypothetical protein [Gemmataceae bacterium]
MNGPQSAYRDRAAHFRDVQARLRSRWNLLASCRFALVLAAVVLFWIVVGGRSLSWYWILPPILAFVVLSRPAERLFGRLRYAERAIAFYENGLARLNDSWAGRGRAGTQYVDESHLYAADLDLFGNGSLFERLCLARTLAGRDTLARWLLAPAEPHTVQARQAAVKDLRDRFAWRESLALLAIDLPEAIDTVGLAAWGTALGNPAPFVRWLAPCILAITLMTLFGWFSGWWGLVPFVAALLLQGGFALLVRGRTRQALAGLHTRSTPLLQLTAFLARFEREPFQAPRLGELQSALMSGGEVPSRRLARLAHLVELEDYTHNIYFAGLAWLLLWTTQVVLRVEVWRQQTGPALGRWFDVLGEVEALASLASYAYENPDDPFPEVVAEGPVLEGEALGHPLLPRVTCVANDVTLNAQQRVLIVSGSNMSGKSTYLRTVGCNAVLALAGAPVRARSLKLSPLAIGATLRIHDSLREGRSRFYAEITRLRGIVALADGSLPVLFLFDEMLHGTNSKDRRIGAEGIVRALLRRPTLGMLTTHDLALAEMADRLAPHVVNVHFADALVDGKMHFDYRLRPGVVKQSNALALMRAVGLEVEPRDELTAES